MNRCLSQLGTMISKRILSDGMFVGELLIWKEAGCVKRANQLVHQSLMPSVLGVVYDSDRVSMSMKAP